jgi:outer membrane protein assembly factor BamB
LLLFGAGADWRQFRGTNSRGVAADASIPSSIDSPPHIAWKVKLPGRGPSSPIVVGDRVFVTAAGGPRNDHLYVLALGAATGDTLWQRSFWGTGPVAAHPKTSMAAPTPASDGKHLIALFGTNDLICLDLDGGVRWIRALHEEHPGATDGRGLASSPLIVGNVVIVHVENQNVSFAAGIDIATGVDRWRMERPREICWTTPIPLPGVSGQAELVLLQGMTHLSAVDPQTGKEVWSVKRTSDPIASSVVAGHTLFVPGEKGLAAFELQPDGTPPKLIWEQQKLNPVTSSPLVLGDRIYVLRNDILATGDIKTGEVRGQLRLKGPFSASPVAAGGTLFAVGESGVVQAVKPNGKDGEIISRTELAQTMLASPAISQDAMYLRSDQHMWKLTAAPKN